MGGTVALCDAEISGNYRNVMPLIGHGSAPLISQELNFQGNETRTCVC